MSDLEWRGPKSPLIYSPYSAQRQAEELLELSQFKRLQDKDGGVWVTEAHEDLVPSSLQPDQLERRLKIQHVITLNKKELINQHVCDASHDSRLLKLLGEDKIHCRLSSMPMIAGQQDEMRLRVSRYFEYFKKRIKEEGFRKEKRQALEQWIDRRMFFGSRSIA